MQYLAIRYTERLAANDVVNSVGSKGDSYDNAMAESIFGLYKTELIRNKGPWRGLDDLKLATLEWADWFNHRRLFHELGRIPPAEFEDQHYRHNNTDREVETQTTRLRKTRGALVGVIHRGTGHGMPLLGLRRCVGHTRDVRELG
ncbi:MAG: transposase [Actinobacteria bacterium]|nr:transposase [Actinomycetota bacterium]